MQSDEDKTKTYDHEELENHEVTECVTINNINTITE